MDYTEQTLIVSALKKEWEQLTNFPSEIQYVVSLLPELDFAVLQEMAPKHWRRAISSYILKKENSLLPFLSLSQRRWIEVTSRPSLIREVKKLIPKFRVPSKITSIFWYEAVNAYLKQPTQPKFILAPQPASPPEPKIEVTIGIPSAQQPQPELVLSGVEIPQLVVIYPPKTQAELAVSNAIAKLLSGKREVHCPPVGRIDVLTELEVIEVKEADGWKHAVGQVTIYGFHHPAKQKVIFLFGKNAHTVYQIAVDYCIRLGIELRIYDHS